MLVKICGITTVEDGLAVANAGADMVGFVFAKSKRQVAPEQARAISTLLPPELKKVGVFVNESLEEVERVIEAVGLDYAQLHGQESPSYCEQLSVPVIKAFQIKTSADFAQLANYSCSYYLLDSPAGQYQGGNGESFDWKLAKHVTSNQHKIILAGGLNQENVTTAIDIADPIGVDVSSGVETDGKKDHQKINAFIRKAKER